MGILDRIRGVVGPKAPVRPMAEQGVGGFRIYRGYLDSNETNYKLIGTERWKTAADLLANVSIIAAGVRYSLNLISRPSWTWEPADESDKAKQAAEFMESVVDGIDASWTRIIRRAGMYRYHGFGVHEWVAKKREEDGKIGIASIESRPQHTIERWDIDANGGVKGVWQRDPITGDELYLPREKLLYLVDDTITDSPDGMGWFRHLAEPANALKSYLALESIGFERDLTGIPVGRAPLQKLNQLVADGKITATQRDSMLAGMEAFVSLKRKDRDTSLILDSTTFKGKSETGESVSAIYEWGMELLTGEQSSIDQLGLAIRRLKSDMAMIMGTESLLVGAEGEGSRALSEDKSRNLYLTANATLSDMRESVERDIRDAVWKLNGLPEELKPRAKVEDVAFKDAEQIARALADMANAGAILAPDDPAINDVRDLMGISAAPPMDLKTLNALQGKPDPTEPTPDKTLDDERAREAMDREDARAAEDRKAGNRPGPGKPGSKPAKKFDPNQPRDPGGEDGGQWVKDGGTDDRPDTIEVNGERRPTTDSSGRPLAKDEAGTRRFYEWFGDSKAVDDQGRPLLLHHATTEDFDSFEPSSNGQYGKGIYFGTDREAAERFGVRRDAPAPKVVSGYVAAKNPAFIESPDFDGYTGARAKSLHEKGYYNTAFQYAQSDDGFDPPKDGYDALVASSEYGGTEWVVYRPEQFKSSDNAGTFDSSSAEFRKYNPNQPRAPKGSEDGGQWSDHGGGSSASQPVASPRGMAIADEDEDAIAALDRFSGDGLEEARDAKAQIGGKGDGDKFFSKEAFDQAQAVIDRGNKAAIVHMHPRDFLAMAYPGHLKESEDLVSSILEDKGSFNTLPELKFTYGDNQKAQFANHDGRHRARAILAAGATEMPVLLRGSSMNKGGAGDWRDGSITISSERRNGGALTIPAPAAKYDPNQPRDPAGTSTGGRWTATGASSPGHGKDKGEVRQLDGETKRKITDTNAGKTLEELYAMAEENQMELGEIGTRLENELGLKFSDPGTKGLASAQRKLASEPYDGPHQLTDLARASFVVNHPGDAEKVIEALAHDAVVYDKGWVTIPQTNYIDRKLLVQFDNGGVAEIQLLPTELAPIKGIPGFERAAGALSGAGHKLYEIARNPNKPLSIRDRATNLSRNLYTRALAGGAFASLAGAVMTGAQHGGGGAT